MKTLRILLVALTMTGIAATVNAGCRIIKPTIMYSNLTKFAAFTQMIQKLGKEAPEVMNTMIKDMANGDATYGKDGTEVIAITPVAETDFVVVSLKDPYRLFLATSDSLTCD
jgi:hypothetical protein